MFSTGVEDALRVAEAAHAGQTRKGPSGAPYILHPVHVALLVARWGYGDVEIQAALLHDVVEDCEGWTVEKLAERFGARVAGVVAELSEDKRRPWQERKEAGIRAVATLSPEACVVKAADKLHNLRTLQEELAASPDPELVWRRFNGGRERTIEMDRRLVGALAARVEPRIARELEQAVAGLAKGAGALERA